MLMSQTYLRASVLVLAVRGVIAQIVEGIVPFQDNTVPQFQTPLNDAFIVGRSDLIPKLIERALFAYFGAHRILVLNNDPSSDQLMVALSGPSALDLSVGIRCRGAHKSMRDITVA